MKERTALASLAGAAAGRAAAEGTLILKINVVVMHEHNHASRLTSKHDNEGRMLRTCAVFQPVDLLVDKKGAGTTSSNLVLSPFHEKWLPDPNFLYANISQRNFRGF